MSDLTGLRENGGGRQPEAIRDMTGHADMAAVFPEPAPPSNPIAGVCFALAFLVPVYVIAGILIRTFA